MGLTYHYKLEAPADTPAHRLEEFLRTVEIKAKDFPQTLVLNAVFNSRERQVFARRLVTGYHVADERLKKAALPLRTPVWDHGPSQGTARLIPAAGVFLIVGDEQGCETFFGFFRYPELVKDAKDQIVAEAGLRQKWIFEDWVKTPDPRFRTIVKEFSAAGYVVEEHDDYR